MNANVNVLGSIVTALKGLVIGYQSGYSTETSRMTKNDVGMAFSYRDVDFHFRCNSIPHEFGLSVVYKGETFSLQFSLFPYLTLHPVGLFYLNA